MPGSERESLGFVIKSAAKPGAYQFDEATTPERVAAPVSAGRMIEKEV